MIKQKRIDNGRLGGIINTFGGSSFIFGIFTYINSAAIAYSLIIKYYISLHVYILLTVIFIISWFVIYYVYITPSQNRFIQNQAWEHGSPIRKSFEDQKKILERIEEKLK